MTREEKYMNMALKEAEKAYKDDEVPVGAIIVLDDKVIARAHNRREKSKDATAHAEILAIRKACRVVGDFRLLNAEIYVTLEPCLMCMGAILNSRIKTVYFGASVNKPGALTLSEIVSRAELNHKSKVVGGVLEDECSSLVSQYFKGKRKQA